MKCFTSAHNPAVQLWHRQPIVHHVQDCLQCVDSPKHMHTRSNRFCILCNMHTQSVAVYSQPHLASCRMQAVVYRSIQVPTLAKVADAFGTLRGVWRWLYTICFFVSLFCSSLVDRSVPQAEMLRVTALLGSFSDGHGHSVSSVGPFGLHLYQTPRLSHVCIGLRCMKCFTSAHNPAVQLWHRQPIVHHVQDCLQCVDSPKHMHTRSNRFCILCNMQTQSVAVYSQLHLASCRMQAVVYRSIQVPTLAKVADAFGTLRGVW